MTAAHKRDRHGFRGVPPPPLFDFDALPDGALLNEYETAAVGRWSTNTLAAWRLRAGHGLRWVVIAGGFIRYRVSAIRAFLADAAPRKRKLKPPPPAAAPPRRRAEVKPRSRGDAVPAAQEVVRPSFFVNENEFYAPLAQVTPSTERQQLADDLTANEVKTMLIADANALEHGSAKPLSPYAKAQIAWRRRAAKMIPAKQPETIRHENELRETVAHQRKLALDLIGRVKNWRDERKGIAYAISVAFGCSEREVVKKLGKWRKEFLRSHPAAEK